MLSPARSDYGTDASLNLKTDPFAMKLWSYSTARQDITHFTNKRSPYYGAPSVARTQPILLSIKWQFPELDRL